MTVVFLCFRKSKCPTPDSKMNLEVEKWVKSKDGPLSVQNMEKKLRSQGYSFTKYTFSPGTDFPDHTHGYEKKDSIVTGKFWFRMYGKEVVLEPGDMMVVQQILFMQPASLGMKMSYSSMQQNVKFSSVQRAYLFERKM